jgi:hypothetical protein
VFEAQSRQLPPNFMRLKRAEVDAQDALGHASDHLRERVRGYPSGVKAASESDDLLHHHAHYVGSVLGRQGDVDRSTAVRARA